MVDVWLPDDIVRFMSKFIIGNKDECWPWLYGVDGNGYGCLKVKKKMIKAHRAIYFLATGIDPGEFLICHTCDNRKCVNPNHLFRGTIQDNVRDRDDKGRQSNNEGENNGNSKLTLEQVNEIRSLEGLMNQREIAKKFNISYTNVNAILLGKSWR